MNDFEIGEYIGKSRRSVKWKRGELGLESHFYNNYGNNYVSNNGTVCLSFGELEICNFLDGKNIQYEKEVFYNKCITNDVSQRRFDWVIKDKNGIKYMIEYFGMYDSKSMSKIKKLYRKSTRKKIGDLCKWGVAERCIFIFPNDLKNKSLEEIFAKVL